MPDPIVENAASPAHALQMRALAEFLGLDKISYHDHGMREDYFLYKGDRRIRITAEYSCDQGGFLVVDRPERI